MLILYKNFHSTFCEIFKKLGKKQNDKRAKYVQRTED